MYKKIISVFLSVCLIVPITRADETPQVTESSVASTAASGTNPGSVAPSGSADNLLFTGSFLYSIPIEIPPGVSGFQPQLALLYNSSAGNGWAGVGWDLSVGTIQRSVKNGVPSYSDADTFVFTSRGQTQELVKIEDGTYRAKIDGAFLQFIRDGEGWTVRDKTGTVTRFGQTAASRIDHPAVSGPESAFLWGVDEITGRTGNRMTFSYDKPSGDNQLYLKEILYGANVNAAAPLDRMNRKVTFARESRPDVMTSYRPGFFMKTADRLKQIETFVLNGGSWVAAKRTTLAYRIAPNRKRSTLAHLTVTGIDGTDSLSLPPFEFSQASFSPSWSDQGRNSVFSIPFEMTMITAASAQGAVAARENGTRLVELNGDGRPDLIRYILVNGSEDKKTFLNTASGWENVSPQWQLPEPILLIGSVGLDNGIRFTDLNGDGLTDFVLSSYWGDRSPPVLKNAAYLNTGSGWSDRSATWSMPADPDNPTLPLFHNEITEYPSNKNHGVQFVDLNGDGRSDLVQAYKNGYTGALISRAWINNGAGWTRNDAYALPAALSEVATAESLGTGVALIDLNGDGLTDCAQRLNDLNVEEISRVWINTGPGWSDVTQTWALPGVYGVRDPAGGGSYRSNGAKFADLNGDGLIDWIQAISGYNAWDVRNVYLNTGRGWEPTGNWWPPDKFEEIVNGVHYDRGYFYADMNADGNADLVRSFHHSTWIPYLFNEVYLSLTKSNVLTSIKTPFGGEISLAYGKQPTSVRNPVPITVLSEMNTFDRRGGSVNSSYRYFNGLFDKTEKEFLGFGIVHAVDAGGNTTVTYYLQDKNPDGQPAPAQAFKGRVFKTEQRDSSGTLLAGLETRWGATEPHAGVYFVRPQWQTRTDYTGTAPLTVKSETFYDSTGNVIRVVHEGDVAVTGDEFTEEIDYAVNAAANLLSFPQATRTLDGAGGVLSERRFFYDGSLLLGEITQGNVTEVRDWLDRPSEKWIASKSTYDSRGLVSSVTGAKNFTTTTSFDEFGYPVSVTNPLGHTVHSTYDPRTGSVLTDTDVNGQTTTYRYDALGRSTAVVGPLDSDTFPGVEILYHDALLGDPHTQYVETRTRERHGEPGTIWTKDYFDGLGRTHRSEREDMTGRFVVSESKFDSRGLRTRASVPRFNDSTGPTLWTDTEYDPLRRPILTAAPDGTMTQTAYQGRLTFVTDPNGNTQGSETDAYGRVVKRYEPSVPNPTVYDYDAAGNLVRVIDSLGHSTNFEYDSLGRKLEMQDPNAGTWDYSYDDNGNLVGQTDARGVTLAMDYDALDRLVEKRSGAQILAHYTYDETDPTQRPYSKGRLTTVTDPSGTSSYYHDRLGRVVRSIKTLDGRNYEIQTAYDALGRTVRVTYPNDDVVAYDYDDAGRLARVTNADGTEVLADYPAYDALGRPLVMSHNNGATQTTYQYDPLRQTLASLQTVSFSTSPARTIQHLSYAFDDAGDLLSIDDQLDSSMSQTFEYDALHRLVKATGLYGEETYSYDSLGNFLTKGPLSYHYDDPLHPYAVTGIAPAITPAEDESTLLAWKLDPSEPIYSIQGAVSSEGGAGAPSIKVALTGTFDQALAADVESETSFDGAFEFRGLPGGAGTVYSLSVSSSGGQTNPSGYGYTDLNASYSGQNFTLLPGDAFLDIDHVRVPRTAFAHGGSLLSSSASQIEPDPATEPDPTEDPTTDPAAEPTADPIMGTAPEGIWMGIIIGGMGYGGVLSTDGTIQHQTGYFPIPDSADLTQQPSSQYVGPPSTGGQGVVGPAFVEGRLNQALSFNGTADVFVFPQSQSLAPDRLTVMIWVKPEEFPSYGSATLFSKSNGASLGNLSDGFRLSLDSGGTVDFEIGTSSGSLNLVSVSPLPLDSWSFLTGTYDGSAMKLYVNDQLSAETAYAGGLVSNTHPASIGASLTEWKRSASGTFFKGALDEPRLHGRAWTAEEIVQAYNVFTGGLTFTYDADGNIKTKTTNGVVVSYNYDVQGRLTSVSRGGNPESGDPAAETGYTSFVYDGDGGRVKKISMEGGETAYIGKLFEIKSDDTYVNHVFAGNQMISDVVAPQWGGPAQTFDIHADHLGSASLVTDSAGAMVQSLHYSPFGEIVKSVGDSPLRHQYTGQESDPETGLYYYNARYYDPINGRFISPDTIDQEPYDPQSMNRYAYVRNNPLNLVDPSGQSWLSHATGVHWDINRVIYHNLGINQAGFAAFAGPGGELIFSLHLMAQKSAEVLVPVLEVMSVLALEISIFLLVTARPQR